MGLNDYKTKPKADKLIDDIEQSFNDIDTLESDVDELQDAEKEKLTAISALDTTSATASDIATAFNSLIADLQAKGYMETAAAE